MNVIQINIAKSIGGSMNPISIAELVENRGIIGDRYFNDNNRPSDDYQVTLIESENIDCYCMETGNALRYIDTRRNIVTKDVRLNRLVGKYFRLGSCELYGIELCEPCKTFESRTYPGVLKWFVGRGGLRCKITQGGTIKLNDTVTALI